MLKKKDFNLILILFRYFKTLTDENEILTGGDLYILNRRVFVLAIADDVWTNDEKVPFGFFEKDDDNVIYIGRYAIKFY